MKCAFVSLALARLRHRQEPLTGTGQFQTAPDDTSPFDQTRQFMVNPHVPTMRFRFLDNLFPIAPMDDVGTGSAAEPILMSSMIRRSYGAKPATSRMTSRIMPTRSDLWPLRLLGLGAKALFVTMCPLLSPAANPVFASAPIWTINTYTPDVLLSSTLGIVEPKW